jgi:hypothetical protein
MAAQLEAAHARAGLPVADGGLRHPWSMFRRLVEADGIDEPTARAVLDAYCAYGPNSWRDEALPRIDNAADFRRRFGAVARVLREAGCLPDDVLV